jgi:hypothetical protein
MGLEPKQLGEMLGAMGIKLSPALMHSLNNLLFKSFDIL